MYLLYHTFYLFNLENKDHSYLKPTRTNTRIRFTEDSILEEPKDLMRVPTPHPKKMRAFAKMLLERKNKNNVIIINFVLIFLIIK